MSLARTGGYRGGSAGRRGQRGQPVARGRPARRSRPARVLAAGAGRAAGRAGRDRPAGAGQRDRPGATFPLTLADLPGLLALPTLVAGVASLRSRREAGPAPAGPAPPAGSAATLAPGADGYVLASALFIIGWITVFSAAYTHSGDDPAMFAGELVHPLADLLVLGGLLPLAVAAGRRGVAPLIALLLITLSDTLAVGARVSNGHPGTAAQLLLIAGLCVLGSAPWLDARDAGHPGSPPVPGGRAARHDGHRRRGRRAGRAGGDRRGTGRRAGGAPGAGRGRRHRAARAHRPDHPPGAPGQRAGPAVARVGPAVPRAGRPDQRRRAGLRLLRADQLRQSRRSRDYGYAPADLEGETLADLVHPEDQPDGLRAVREAASAEPATQVRYSCRVRAADGTWRYVEATISRHRSQGAPDRLLITARDVSDQVALRRQVAQPDLPRRADRAAQPGLPGGPGAGSAQPGPPRAAASTPGRRGRGWPGSSWSTWTASPG